MLRTNRFTARLVIALALAVPASGCATIASHEEYAAYRRTRTESDETERTLAMAEYSQQYPNGIWSTEVGSNREGGEDQLWATSNGTVEGLNNYLAAYPDGQYVAQARARLQAMGSVAGRRQQEQVRSAEAQAAAREQAVEDRRLWVTREVQFWTRTLLGIRNYGSPISQVARSNAEFSRAFGREPQPLCTPASCIKHYHASYAIPVPGATRIDRQMHVLLRIKLDRGRVERVELLLPNKGFSRWFELENRTIVTDEDPEQRQAALMWALDRIEPIIAEVARGAQTIDVVPDPIVPISQQAQQASERATESDQVAPDGTTEAETPPPAAAEQPAPGQPAPQEGSIDALLQQAVGPEEAAGSGDPGADATAAEEAPTATMVLPIGLRGVQRGNVRMVVFAAGDEDYGDAYDGFYVERVRD